MAAPPAKARKDPATNTPDILVPLKNEAAKTVEFVIAQPEKICQKMGMAAFELRNSVCQYTNIWLDTQETRDRENDRELTSARNDPKGEVE